MDVAVKLLIAIIITLIFYTYMGYPMLLMVLGIFPRRKKRIEDEDLPSVALIISAHNEERIIREKIENSLQIDYPSDLLRVIVASDGSIDDTDAIVREYEGKSNIVLKTFERREGKSATLNKAVLGVPSVIFQIFPEVFCCPMPMTPTFSDISPRLSEVSSLASDALRDIV